MISLSGDSPNVDWPTSQQADIPSSMTCSGDLTTFDAVIADAAEMFLASLSPVDREQFYRALDVLCSDPYPDGISKISLAFFPTGQGPSDSLMENSG